MNAEKHADVRLLPAVTNEIFAVIIFPQIPEPKIHECKEKGGPDEKNAGDKIGGIEFRLSDNKTRDRLRNQNS
jgi:hypothetical protein